MYLDMILSMLALIIFSLSPTLLGANLGISGLTHSNEASWPVWAGLHDHKAQVNYFLLISIIKLKLFTTSYSIFLHFF